MSKQLYDTGDVLQAGSNTLECSAVSHQVDPDTQEQVKFSYTFRLQSEVEAERQAEIEHQKALEVAEKENAKLAPTEGADNDTAGESEEA